MHKRRVGILRGGTDENYDSSVIAGGDLMAHIFENLYPKWKPIDILVDKNGIWHLQGVPIKPAELSGKVDVVWNSSHPSFSQVLETLSIPNRGTGVFPTLLKSNREMLEEHMKDIGVNMPKSVILPLYQEDFDGPKEKYAINSARKVFEKFSPPWVVRSLVPDSNIGVHVAKTFPELSDAIAEIASHKKSILVEELIVGKAVAMHSVGGFRGEEVYNLPAVGIKNGVISTEAFSNEEKKDLTDIARSIYNHVGAKGYLKSNFVFCPNKGVFLTSIDLSPNFKEGSHLAESCRFVSVKPHQLLEHILESAL